MSIHLMDMSKTFDIITEYYVCHFNSDSSDYQRASGAVNFYPWLRHDFEQEVAYLAAYTVSYNSSKNKRQHIYC